MEDGKDPSHRSVRLGREAINVSASVDNRMSFKGPPDASVLTSAALPPGYARMPLTSATTTSSISLEPKSDPATFLRENAGTMNTSRGYGVEVYKKSADESMHCQTGSRASDSPSDSDNTISSLSVESRTKNNDDFETDHQSSRMEKGYDSRRSHQLVVPSAEVKAKKNRHIESTEVEIGNAVERVVNSGKRKFDLSKSTLSRKGGEASIPRTDKLSPIPRTATQHTVSSSSGDATGSLLQHAHALSESGGSGDSSKPGSRFADLNGKSDYLATKEEEDMLCVKHRSQPPPKKRKFAQNKESEPDIEIPKQYETGAHRSSHAAEHQDPAVAQEDKGAKLEAKRGYNRMNAARARKRFKDRIDELQRIAGGYREDVAGLKQSNDDLELRLTELKVENEELVNNFRRLKATFSKPKKVPFVDATQHASSLTLTPTTSSPFSLPQPPSSHLPVAQAPSQPSVSQAPSQPSVSQAPSQPNPLLASLLGRLMAAAQNGKPTQTLQIPAPAPVESTHQRLQQIMASLTQKSHASAPTTLPDTRTSHTVNPSPVPTAPTASVHPESTLLLNLISAMQKNQATQQKQQPQLQHSVQQHTIPQTRPNEQDRTQQMLASAVAQNPALLLQLLQGRFHSGN